VVGHSRVGWRAKLVLLALGTACLLAVGLPVVASEGDTTPTWKLRSYVSRGGDRSFKCDVAEEMSEVPRVVVFGGSRGLRMDPATIRQNTGLAAFNFAFHNGRPEDAWAVTDWLIDRHPDQPPAVIWCVQATTFADMPMAPGLIVDERLSQAFPKVLIDAKMDWALRQPTSNLLSRRRYGFDGMLWWNSYDRNRAAGLTLQQSLTQYLDATLLAKAGNGQVPHNTRAMAYFEHTLRLLNANRIKPLIVIMPYHPRALSAFLSVGWGVKQRWMNAYLKRLQKDYELKVLNCLQISTFGGRPDGFYDGAHLTAGNSRRLIRYCIRMAPSCFVVPEPSPSPSPSPSPGPSPGGSLVPAPAYTPVPEDTSVAADFLE
jgi:hypothetical protein